MDYKIIINRRIIDILIGDEKVYDDYTLPYYSGSQLCDLCCEFGLARTYYWGNKGTNQSRWMYMQDLMLYLNKQGRIPELLARIFDMKNFESLSKLPSPELVEDFYNNIVESALKKINVFLMLAKQELRVHKGRFALVEIGKEPVFNTPKVKVVNRQYVQELPDRIKDDIKNKDFDSVITKSRTLLEEVLIFIIEKLTHERYKSSGNLIKIYNETTELLNMRQQNNWDTRVNELLGGLHKIVSAISSMRNINSDAHGAGASRVNIKEREAVLTANSSMILAEYWLSVYEKK